MSSLRAKGCVLAVLLLTAAAGCGGGGRHKSHARSPDIMAVPTSSIDTRIAAAGSAWARYSPEDQALIKRGDFRVGLDELAVYIARGAPEIWWRTRQGNETCNVLFYSTADASAADLSVLTCGGSADFAPRMVEHAAYFETLPLTRQWDLAVGALERGQTGADVAIGYGKPYSVGAEAREDGSQASTLVFLDSAQEAYALHVTLVDNVVVGWKIPAERVLTPQAQQRRATAAARQAVDEARAADQQAAARYAEETRARNDAQAKRQFALATVTAVASVAASQAAASAPSTPTSVNASSSTTKTSSEKTLTLNGCTYKESGGGALGQSCGACPASYICSIVGGSTGFCVPASQHNACRGSKRR